MKILHIITGLGDGGAEGVLRRLVTSDDASAHQVVSLMDSGVHGDQLTASGIPVHLLGMPRGRVTFSGLMRLFRLVREVEPDVVQTWMYHADLIGGVVSRVAGRPALVWGIRNTSLDHGMVVTTTRVVAWICARLSRVIPARIVSCSARAAEAHAEIGYDRRKITVIPNGYDVSLFRPDPDARARVRCEWGIAGEIAVIGMVARWDPQKDHQTLIQSLGVLNTGTGMNWRCMLIGHGMIDGNADLVGLLMRAGVAERVTLLGTRRDMPAVMNGLDLHVLSSASEGFPNVVAEAMACGTPCVVTDVGDAASIVDVTGWVVPAREPEQLAHAIGVAIAAMQDKAPWLARQVAARARIEENFGIERMVRAYLEVWESTLRTV